MLVDRTIVAPLNVVLGDGYLDVSFGGLTRKWFSGQENYTITYEGMRYLGCRTTTTIEQDHTTTFRVEFKSVLPSGD